MTQSEDLTRRVWEEKPDPPPTTKMIKVACAACGVRGVPLEVPVKGRVVVHVWPLCPMCAGLLAAADGDQQRARVAYLSEVLPEEDVHADESACVNAAALIPTGLHVEAYGMPSTGEDRAASLAHLVHHRSPIEGQGSVQRWQHVTDADRTSIRDELRRQRRLARPRRHRDGPCGGCSVERSLRWRTGVKFYAPGSTRGVSWPLCQECAALHTRASRSVESSTWAAVLTADALGAKVASMGMSGVKAYALLCAEKGITPDRATAYVERWGYLTDADWQRLWEAYPKHPPEHVRAARERRQRVAAARAVMEAKPPSALDLPEPDTATMPGIRSW